MEEGSHSGHRRAPTPRSDAFQRAGEMGRRIAETDWEQTALGKPEHWPKSFQTTVGTLLGSRYPMILLWGSELLQFYNDAYIGLIGAKHPAALGRSIRETQAESWEAIGPMIHAVMSSGTPNWVAAQQLPLLRSGYLEESYFSLSYSAVDDDAGVISGMLCVCSEVTEQIVSARRMQLLRELGAAGEVRGPKATCEQLAAILEQHALDVPFAALYLRTPDGAALELCGAANLPSASAFFPARVTLPAQAGALPFAAVLQGRSVSVEQLERHFSCSGGPFGDSVKTALLLPLASLNPAEPLGVLVAALSPARALDEGYRTFYELLAGQVATLLRNALAFEQESQRAAALAEIDRVKTTFFSNVSHEFRTPLTLILGPLEDALHRPARSLDGPDLDAVHRNALRLLRLVNTLLDFSRLEAGRLEAKFEQTDLATLTAGLAGSFHSAIESAGLKLVVECPPLAEPVWVDRAHWEKIVLNLVSNAFKFTFEGEIAVRLHAHGEQIELRVSDTGTGIPEAELARVFERFHRVAGSRSRSFEGTGIGLAFVQELVQRHGGSVLVESALAKGSTFIVRIPRGTAHLPAANLVAGQTTSTSAADGGAYLLEALHWGGTPAETALAAAEAAESAANALPSGAPARARILVADDNADLRHYLVRLLAPRWQVEAVEDGQAALDAALRHPPDLVLSDVMMPRMDGVALLRELRAQPATSAVPVILLSARAGEDAVVGGLETGADDYLVKPFSARELLTRVSTHLELARSRRAAIAASNALAETRARLLANLESKNRELEAFSYSVSHDLRSPLRSIDGFSLALLEDYANVLDQQGRGYLERVRQAAQHMGELIDDLILLARVSRAELTRERVSISELAQSVLGTFQQAEPARQVSALIQPSLYAQADQRLLRIVLDNLLGNAWKFTARTAAARIEVGAEEQAGQRVYFVRDNGAGFDMAYAQKLFSAFQRLHSDADFPGTGIGLATVARIVERHGGRAWANGEVGRGASIFFTLPVASEIG